MREAEQGHSTGLKSVGPPPPLPTQAAAETTEPEEVLLPCIICLDKPKEYAFVPCGHLAVCGGCMPSLDKCPVCRGPREGMLRVEPTEKLCVCKHCKQVIFPTFFDSHREVCRMRMREQQIVAAAAEETEEQLGLCVVCSKERKDRVMLPCGHFLLCHGCAATVATCPACCTTVKSTMAVFES
jgi:hypothetical protein